MMYSFSEQIIMSVKFIMLGMFAGIMMDGSYELNFKKKIPNILVQLIFWVIMTFVICRAMLVISNGYIPIYTFLFFIIGFSIYYYFLKKSYIHTLRTIKNVFRKNQRKIYAIIFPRQVTRFIAKLFRKILMKIFKPVKSLFKRKKKNNDELEQNTDQILLDNANKMIS